MLTKDGTGVYPGMLTASLNEQGGPFASCMSLAHWCTSIRCTCLVSSAIVTPHKVSVGCLLQLVEGMSTKEELQDLCRLLDFLAHEINGNSNFEFVQALLRLVLQVSRSEACLTT